MCGESQFSNAPSSSLHWNCAGSGAVNAKLGEVSLLGLFGSTVIVVVGAPVSIVHV